MNEVKRAAPALAAGVVAMGAAAVLLAAGRPAICTCGTVKLWVAGVTSPDTSQHLFDWYTPSHLIHGLIFYALLSVVTPRLSVGWRGVIALLIEAAWEVAENSQAVIDRYREATIALGYTGDSVLNSLSDMAAMGAGFLLARWLPAWASVVLAIGLELAALAAVRDNLTLNVIMLVAPSDAIRAWQAGG